MPEIREEVHKLRKQVRTLAEFGKQALQSHDIGGLLQEATKLVSDAIEIDLVKVLQLLPGGDELLVRAGVNWNPGVVGHATIPGRQGSSAGYALRTNEPVITEDIAAETRFSIPRLLFEHGVKSTVNVVIRGEDGPFGVLEVDSRQLRRFEQDDINFLQNYANLLAAAIDRVKVQHDLAESAAKQKVLGFELQHRINNMLATIRAVARRTRAKSQDLEEFAKAFDERLAAIARTHSLLSRSEEGEVDIRELLALELSAHGAVEGENLSQRGPVVPLSAKQAQVLAMALHELTTNAVKYGALSVGTGRIEVFWNIEVNGTETQLRLRWRESGVPIENEPVRRGYGSEILEKSIPHMLHGKFERTFNSDGIECLILASLTGGRDDERPDRS